MERFGLLGGADSGNLRRKGVVKEGLHHIMSVTSQVAISGRVERYRLALGARREGCQKLTMRLFILLKGMQMGLGSCAT